MEISSGLSKQEREDVCNVLREYSDVFSGNPNRTTAAVHKIDVGDAEPIQFHIKFRSDWKKRSKEKYRRCLRWILSAFTKVPGHQAW